MALSKGQLGTLLLGAFACFRLHNLGLWKFYCECT